ncbi:hypothetical protein R3P38DRAFT_3438904 [Favolaschia claudopus]|uniref:Uncharacterized protein n=1 Tax=Favolaschia claudopus TaxID=2862362 RepID=A0AAV9ZRH5_9AGAR
MPQDREPKRAATEGGLEAVVVGAKGRCGEAGKAATALVEDGGGDAEAEIAALAEEDVETENGGEESVRGDEGQADLAATALAGDTGGDAEAETAALAEEDGETENGGEESVRGDEGRTAARQTEETEAAAETSRESSDPDSPEERWRQAELERIGRRRERERKRKDAQLLRRAEQPLPFPGLGYSFDTWTEPGEYRPRPFPIPKKTTPQAMAPAANDRTSTTRRANASGSASVDLKRTRWRSTEDDLLEDEYDRIQILHAHSPWAETRFARYLNVETLNESGDEDREDGGEDRDGESNEGRGERNKGKQAVREDWERMLAEARRSDKQHPPSSRPEMLPAAEVRRRQDASDALKWAQRRRETALEGILGLLGDSRDPDGRLRSLLRSELRVKRLRGS